MAKLPLLLVLVVTVAAGSIIWLQQRELADLERWKEATLQELKRSPTASVLAVNGAAGVQTDCPPPPPPCPAPSGGGGSGSDLPPPATAGKNEDWRVPPGPIPPRPLSLSVSMIVDQHGKQISSLLGEKFSCVLVIDSE